MKRSISHAGDLVRSKEQVERDSGVTKSESLQRSDDLFRVRLVRGDPNVHIARCPGKSVVTPGVTPNQEIFNVVIA